MATQESHRKVRIKLWGDSYAYYHEGVPRRTEEDGKRREKEPCFVLGKTLDY